MILNPSSSERPYFHDFEHVAFGKQVFHTFEIQNREREAVTVHDLLASCTCTSPRIQYRAEDGSVVRGNTRERGNVITIPPNTVAEVTLAIDTTRVQRKNIHKLEQVRIRSDSENTPYLTLEMHIVVDLFFQATPAKVELQGVGQSVGASKRVDIVRDPPDSFGRILGVADASGGLETTLEETVVANRPMWVLVVTLEPLSSLGPYRGYVELETTNPDGQGTGRALRIPVSAQIEKDVLTHPALLQFPPIVAGQESLAEVKLVSHLPGHRLLVRSSSIEGEYADHLELSAQPILSDSAGRASEWSLKLKSDGTLGPNGLSGDVLLELDDEQYPRMRIPYRGVPRRSEDP